MRFTLAFVAMIAMFVVAWSFGSVALAGNPGDCYSAGATMPLGGAGTPPLNCLGSCVGPNVDCFEVNVTNPTTGNTLAYCICFDHNTGMFSTPQGDTATLCNLMFFTPAGMPVGTFQPWCQERGCPNDCEPNSALQGINSTWWCECP